MKGIHNEDDEKTAENDEDKVFEPKLPINNHDLAFEERNIDKQMEKEATHDIQEEKREKIEIFYLENSQQSKLGVTYQCDSCNYQSTNKQALKWHIEREHEGVRYPCDICSHQSKSKVNLKDHKALKHKIDPTFRCTLCDYCTNHTTAWIGHAKRKHPKFQPQEIFTETRRSDRKQWTRQQ